MLGHIVANFFIYLGSAISYPFFAAAEGISGFAHYLLGLYASRSTPPPSLAGRDIEQLDPSPSQQDVRIANLLLSMTANPPHMGHMHAIALAIKALVERGYQIGQVRITLSSEDYAKQKVYYQNASIEKHNEKISNEEKPGMLKVFLERAVRIEFLQEVIRQAKQDGIFENSLNITCWENAPDDLRLNLSNLNRAAEKAFLVCGADFAKDAPQLFGENGIVQHAIIISRKESDFSQIIKVDGDHQILITNDDKTSEISSSKIQNGEYQLLAPGIREKFQRLHQAAQPASSSLSIQREKSSEQVVGESECSSEEMIRKTKKEQIQKIPCPIAKATLLAIFEGSYTTPSGIRRDLENGKDHLLPRSRIFPNIFLESPEKPSLPNSVEVTVVEKDCLEAARDELKNGAKKVALLVLASPIEAGGGMEDGAQGQEEEVCRRSNLCDLMWDQTHFIAKETLFPLVSLESPTERAPIYSNLKENKILLVSDVTVFRAGPKDHYQLLEEPFKVGMLISPGLNRPHCTYEKKDRKSSYRRPEDQEQLRKLMATQLRAALEESYDTVILGAFGCGAFENPPDLIASYYKEIIDQLPAQTALKRIVFAIIEPSRRGPHNPEGNFKPFAEKFLRR